MTGNQPCETRPARAGPLLGLLVFLFPLIVEVLHHV